MNVSATGEKVRISINGKNVSYFENLYKVSHKDFKKLIRESNGNFLDSCFDESLDYVVVNEDVYFNYINGYFTRQDELHYLNINSLKYGIIIISEREFIKSCHDENGKTSKEFVNFIGEHGFYHTDEYVIMNTVSTGWDFCYDKLCQISAVKVRGNSIVDTIILNVNYDHEIPDEVKNTPFKMCSINKYKNVNGVSHDYMEFVGDLPILSCNTYLKNEFLSYYYYNVDKKNISNKYVDIVEILYNLSSNGFIDDVVSVFERSKFNLMKNQLNSIMWCMRMFEFYESLKNALTEETLEKFVYNPFLNRTFTFEGTFKKFNRDEVCEIIKSLDGNVATRINERINYLVLSNDKYFEYHNGKKSSKMLKVFNLISDGNNIKVISENVMVKLINNYKRENHVKML